MTERRKQAEHRGQIHGSLADLYRVNYSDDRARFHEHEARRDGWKAMGTASDWILDVVLALIPGNDGCRR